MKRIVKQSEPNSLVGYRVQPHASYSGIPFDVKQELKRSLLSEQGYICCYCMKRIPENSVGNEDAIVQMKVEHFKCQDSHDDLGMVYTNLLAACMGNEGMPKKLQTCDSRKGSLELQINPLSTFPSCDNLFKYNSDGQISSVNDDQAIDRQLNEVLNLNMQTLRDARREVYMEIQRRVRDEGKRLRNKNDFMKLLVAERSKWASMATGKFRPFCMVACYYLDKKIRQQ